MNSRFTLQRKNAFSLVELSIVLVILGLLTGGILAGKSLIRAAELRRLGTQYQSYVTAVASFRDKYFYLPGDLPNATSIWGAVSTNATTCYNNTTNDMNTCNGNGNGLIHYGNGNEIFRFWQHLANAGLIEGTYTGITGTGGPNYDAVPGWNVPVSSIGNVGWTPFSLAYTSNSYFPDSPTANRFYVGVQSSPQWTTGGFLLAPELWNLDTKLDDGMPMLGRVRVNGYYLCTNAANSADTAATYYMVAPLRCALSFEKIG